MSDPKLHIRFMNTNLTRLAFGMCLVAHEGQEDRAGLPYYTHPVRVAEKMDSELEVVTALLHDVVEDSDTTLDDLRERFPREVIRAIECLTKRDGELTSEYLERVITSQLAVKVKLADIEDNMRLERYENPTPGDVWACDRYVARYEQLKPHLRDEKHWLSKLYFRVGRIKAKNERIIAANPTLSEARQKFRQ